MSRRHECLLIFPLNVKKFSEWLPNARCSHSCYLAFKNLPPDFLPSCRFLCILMSSSKKTKELELRCCHPNIAPFLLKDTSACTALLSCLDVQSGG